MKLKKLEFENFKGIKSLEVEFRQVTEIQGRNGTCKSSVFDGFCYLLFGKDSAGRTDFGIKTWDKHGKIIPQIEHSVFGVLEINGSEISLRKTLKEKWVKKRGAVEAEFTGNETLYEFDGVPVTQKEYQERIGNILDENVFKMVTSPTHFTSLKWNVQREFLFTMSEVKDEDVPGKFSHILGKDLEDLKKKIANEKKRIKGVLDPIPSRIDEVYHGIPEPLDWTALEKELAEAKKEHQEIRKAILDKSKAYEKTLEKRNKLRDEIADAKDSIKKIDREYNQKLSEYESVLAVNEKSKAQIDKEIQSMSTEGERLLAKIQSLKEKIESYREEYRSIAEQKFVFDGYNCPVCEKPLDDAEEKRIEMQERFNLDKASKLDDNNAKGKAVKEEIEALNTAIKDLAYQKAEAKKRKEAVQPPPRPEEPKGKQELFELIEVLEAKLSQDDVQEEISEEPILQKIKEIESKLAVKEQIQKAEARIKELQAQQKELSQLLADQEKLEHDILQFTMAKADLVEKKLNQRFKYVKFKLFDIQINGQEIPTCEATFNGVPFSDLSTGERIMAGIDILNAFSEHYNVYAPVFVDNAESLTYPIEIKSQLIKLVAIDKDLEIL